ncbi:MAG TPA: hypothetical protein VMF06_21605 [Candidatus Limnocylindria bacterium]|nr:hypothetical protein [Candidatus Limnocylindria bacterium]
MSKVLNGYEELHASRNEYDWLGSGLYFWEDSNSRALKWAEDEAKKKDGRIKRPAALGAIIDLGNCLNLIDAEHLELVRAAHAAYLDLCDISGLPPARNKGKDLRARYLDKAVFETLHKLREDENEKPFDTVRAFFVEGEPLYDDAGLRSLDHIQICVRAPQNIVGYFLPRG